MWCYAAPARPLPGPNPRQACTAIHRGREFVLVDTGSARGASRRQQSPAQNLSAILLTPLSLRSHRRSRRSFDAKAGAAGRNHKLDVYGPPEWSRSLRASSKLIRSIPVTVSSITAKSGCLGARPAAGASCAAGQIKSTIQPRSFFERKWIEGDSFKVDTIRESRLRLPIWSIAVA